MIVNVIYIKIIYANNADSTEYTKEVYMIRNKIQKSNIRCQKTGDRRFKDIEIPFIVLFSELSTLIS